MPQKPVAKDQLVGQTFGRWTVLRHAGVTPHRMVQWLCRCSCGNEAVVLAMNLRKGASLSCGCLKVERATTHGHTSRIKYGHSSETYRSWTGMMARCYRKTDPEFKNYGNRGITVCPEWHEFERFLLDMGLRPPGTTLDRRDVNGNYTRDNCRWATALEQGENRRTNHVLTIGGISKHIAAWAREWNLEESVIANRIKRGWPLEKLHLPPLKRGHRLKGAQQ